MHHPDPVRFHCLCRGLFPALLLWACALHAHATPVFDFVPAGNAGNAHDAANVTSGSVGGAIAYGSKTAKDGITIPRYAGYINALALGRPVLDHDPATGHLDLEIEPDGSGAEFYRVFGQVPAP